MNLNKGLQICIFLLCWFSLAGVCMKALEQEQEIAKMHKEIRDLKKEVKKVKDSSEGGLWSINMRFQDYVYYQETGQSRGG